jgi:hypothetical protein
MMPRSSWVGLMGNLHCPPTQAGGASGGASVSCGPVSCALARQPLPVQVTPSQTARTSRHVALSASNALQRADCLLWLAGGGKLPPVPRGGRVWDQALFAGFKGCSPHNEANTTAAVLPGVSYWGHARCQGWQGWRGGTVSELVRFTGVQI